MTQFTRFTTCFTLLCLLAFEAQAATPHSLRRLPTCLAAGALMPARTPVVLSMDFSSPIPRSFWALLVAQMQDNHTRLMEGTPMIVRAEHLGDVAVAGRAVAVHLQGRCTTIAFHDQNEPRRLGWVLMDGNHILPGIFIDCNAIAASLARTIGHGPVPESLFMARAIARVTEHEEIHILTQSPEHTKIGIEQASLPSYQLIQPAPLVELDPPIGGSACSEQRIGYPTNSPEDAPRAGQ